MNNSLKLNFKIVKKKNRFYVLEWHSSYPGHIFNYNMFGPIRKNLINDFIKDRINYFEHVMSSIKSELKIKEVK